MPQRRFHMKNRHGCLQCKENRTKCDEKTPKCGRCQRIGAGCSLADPTSGLIFVGIHQSSATTESPKSKSTSSGRSSGRSISHIHEKRERLKLIVYYTLHASKSLTEITIPDDRDQSIWSEWVPELAFEHDFLLHGILGLSALHLALRNISRQKHTILAIHHYSLGVSLFRLQLSNITPDNYCAVFAFSCILAFYSFGIQRSSKTSYNPITRIHEVLTLMRGTSLLVKGDHKFQILSRWMALTLLGYLEGTFKFPQSAPAEVEEMLSKLLQRTSSEVEKDVYLAAIQGLRFNLCCAIEYRHQKQLTLTLFPAISPSEFWEMVGDGEFLALAILANYAVILLWLRKNIWLEGWGKETVDAVRRALPTDWYDCIAWAVRGTERENED